MKITKEDNWSVYALNKPQYENWIRLKDLITRELCVQVLRVLLAPINMISFCEAILEMHSESNLKSLNANFQKR